MIGDPVKIDNWNELRDYCIDNPNDYYAIEFYILETDGEIYGAGVFSKTDHDYYDYLSIYTFYSKDTKDKKIVGEEPYIRSSKFLRSLGFNVSLLGDCTEAVEGEKKYG